MKYLIGLLSENGTVKLVGDKVDVFINNEG